MGCLQSRYPLAKAHCNPVNEKEFSARAVEIKSGHIAGGPNSYVYEGTWRDAPSKNSSTTTSKDACESISTDIQSVVYKYFYLKDEHGLDKGEKSLRAVQKRIDLELYCTKQFSLTSDSTTPKFIACAVYDSGAPVMVVEKRDYTLELALNRNLFDQENAVPLKYRQSHRKYVVFRILNPLCHAIRTLHLQRYVHRDLRPSNILLDFQCLKEEEEKEQEEKEVERHAIRNVQLCDFGLIKKTDNPDHLHLDIFALGCVIYRLLTAHNAPIATRSWYESPDVIPYQPEDGVDVPERYNCYHLPPHIWTPFAQLIKECTLPVAKSTATIDTVISQLALIESL